VSKRRVRVVDILARHEDGLGPGQIVKEFSRARPGSNGRGPVDDPRDLVYILSV